MVRIYPPLGKRNRKEHDGMSPMLFWIQVVTFVFIVAGAVIALTKIM